MNQRWSRFVLADTEQLHRKIADMGQRIRQLEDALTIFQLGASSEIHPLLREELLAIKFGPEVQVGQSTETEPPRDPVRDTMDALGTLSIGDEGASKYFGRSAGSEVSPSLCLIFSSINHILPLILKDTSPCKMRSNNRTRPVGLIF